MPSRVMNEDGYRYQDHCWHDEGPSALKSPYAEPQVCCFCGGHRARMYKRPPGHGRYTPGWERGEPYYEYQEKLDPKHCAARVLENTEKS